MENWQPIFDYLSTLNLPWLPLVLQILGTIVVVAIAVDQMMTKVDFMNKILAVPFLGSLLKFISKFSPLNVREDEKL